MNESQAGADFSRYILDRMRQLEERNLALREQKDRVEGEKRLIENQKLKFEREARKLRSELERLRVGPMIVGTVVDVLDENRVMVKSSTGPRFVVNFSQFIEEEIKPGAQVGLNQQSFAVMCVLPSPARPGCLWHGSRRSSRCAFSQIGGLDSQISEIREIVELPLKRPDLFTQWASSRLKEFCCTGHRARVRPSWPKRLRTAPMRRSFELWARSLCRST